MSIAKILKEASKLNVDERALLAYKIHRSVEKELDAEPISEELKKELDRRWAEHLKNPEAGSSWEEVKAELAKRRRSRKKSQRA